MQKLAVKLIEAMKLCKYVMRNGINTFHKYKYATSADVLEKVNAAFTKQGIATMVVPEIIKDEASGHYSKRHSRAFSNSKNRSHVGR